MFRVVTPILIICSYASAQSGKVETPGSALNDPAVPETIRQSLAPKSYRILPDLNSPVIEIWYRKEVPAQPKNTSADAIYDRLAESTLLGVIHSSKPLQDYRDQTVPAGFYTLRYALIPNDGNHLGVAPSRDFLLLIPASTDPGPDKMLKFQELVALSRQASGTKHPAPLSLVQAESGATPSISKNDEGHVIFTTQVHLSSGEEMPIALVVKGTAPQ
jgi:hypothetical protein